MTILLDEWQEKILQTEGNIALRAGRQVGKSTIISHLAGEYAVKNKGKQILIISATERQAFLLYSKVLMYIDEKYRSYIKKGKDRPTKSEIKLNNKSIIRCLPCGLDGLSVRGYTTDLLIADEAAFIPQAVWPAVTPQLSTTGGHLILLSTPLNKEGFFYEAFREGSGFTTFHISAEWVAENRQEPQRSNMKALHETEKRRMTKAEYAAEYLGEFRDETSQFFPDELIRKVAKGRRTGEIYRDRSYFCGVDLARLGRDETALEIMWKKDKETLVHVDSIVTRKKRLNETYELILEMDRKYDFKEIYIDDGGLGVGVFDYLLANEQTKRKVVAINNRSRPLDKDQKHKKKILKEDLYNNLLMLMERSKITLLNDDELFLSLKGIKYEYVQEEKALTKLRIYGRKGEDGDHIAEGLTRAAWCIRDKRLNIWVR